MTVLARWMFGLLLGALLAIPLRAETRNVGTPEQEASAWLAAFEDLQAHLASDYANFQYELSERRMDLPAIARDYRARLADAPELRERRDILQAFIAEFRDPHLRIVWTDAATPPPQAACNLAQGFVSGIAWQRSGNFTPLAKPQARAFGAGVQRLADGRRIGVVAFRSFSPRDYPQCGQAAEGLSIAPDAPCDRDCAARIDREAGRLLNADLARVLRDLEARGAQAIAVDLVDNEGGTDWAESVLRLLAGDIASPEVGIVSHPAWRGFLDQRERTIRRLPAGPERADALSAIDRARRSLSEDCDLSPAWTDSDLATGRKPLPCHRVATGFLYSSGFVPRASASAREVLYAPQAYGPAARATTLPLTVLVNDNTHSAAELVAAALRDAGAATVMGDVTPGAGCGTYTDDGTGFDLPTIQARVEVPDCVRLRRDGSNERAGIAPDIFTGWGPGDSAWIRLRKTLAALALWRPEE